MTVENKFRWNKMRLFVNTVSLTMSQLIFYELFPFPKWFPVILHACLDHCNASWPAVNQNLERNDSEVSQFRASVWIFHLRLAGGNVYDIFNQPS